ncbi:hypothetical protein K0M31_004061, partial [Melipona bicolor]
THAERGVERRGQLLAPVTHRPFFPASGVAWRAKAAENTRDTRDTRDTRNFADLLVFREAREHCVPEHVSGHSSRGDEPSVVVGATVTGHGEREERGERRMESAKKKKGREPNEENAGATRAE